VRRHFTRVQFFPAPDDRYNRIVLAPLFVCLAMPVDIPAGPLGDSQGTALFDPVAVRAEHMSPGEPRELSKKEEWLREKGLRPSFRTSEKDLLRAAKASKTSKGHSASKALAQRGRAAKKAATGTDPEIRPGQRIEPVTTLFNVWTHESLAILPGQTQILKSRFHRFLRDHFTNQATQMDTRLIGVLTQVAEKFSAKRIDVVSGYRSPKYNLMLRKKGRQVARDSQHTHGNAVDFRIRGVKTKQILHYVRSLRLGGVGYYPNSQFVHSDTGKVRYWTGS
jgi:hypothetical protein